ncbi:MAG: hypothetical protein WAN20_23095, partial [Pseudonocardiaceae bacterium]
DHRCSSFSATITANTPPDNPRALPRDVQRPPDPQHAVLPTRLPLAEFYNAERQYADHSRPVHYELPQPRHHDVAPRDRRQLYVHGAALRGPVFGSGHRG